MESFLLAERASLVTPLNPEPVARRRARPRKVVFLVWLRRIHLYVGLWGAALGLLFGATGIVLNHRAILKITVEKVVQKTAHLALPAGAAGDFRTPQDMERWLRAELKFDPLQMRVRAEPARTVTWADRTVTEPERWTFNLHSPQRGVNAEYHVGNRYIKVETQDATPIGTLTRLHMSVGASAFWVLLSDTIAGGLVVLSITGLLLWTRLHAVRLSAVAVSLAALLGAVWFLWTSL